MTKPISRRTLLAAAPAAALLGSLRASAQGLVPSDEYRFLPVRLHLLRSKTVRELNSRLRPADAQRILGKVNDIWRPAGIQFWTESVLEEEAASAELYAALGENRTEAHLKLIRPRLTQSDRMFHFYFLHEMRPNGYCLDGSYELVFVKDAVRLEKVRGGGDTPIARVLAHEVGHALDLDHRQDTYNLMASGTTGVTLNQEEVRTARRAAERFEFKLKPAAALDHADRTAPGDPKAAESLYCALAELPGGDVASMARQRLEEP